MVRQQITTQETESECSWEVEVEWQTPATIHQNPVFNVEEEIKFEGQVSLKTREAKHIHYKVQDGCPAGACPPADPNCCNRHCVENIAFKGCPFEDRSVSGRAFAFAKAAATVTVNVNEEKKHILRVVPSMATPVPVFVPEFEFKINEPQDQTAHFVNWGVVDIDITRSLPDVEEGDCPQAQYKFKCTRTDTVKNVQHEIMVPQPVIENRVTQTVPAPAPTCSTCNCAAPTPTCQTSGCCR
jgi:hypothetical protein